MLGAAVATIVDEMAVRKMPLSIARLIRRRLPTAVLASGTLELVDVRLG